MPEFKLPALPATGHTTKDPECPFCDDGDTKTYETYAGEHNRSGVLAANMRIGTNGRSQYDKKCRPQEEAAKNPKPALKIKVKVDGQLKQYTMSFQAHHAISGNQAMKGSPIEDWIIKGDTVANNSGYSINNAKNGIWLPSKPSRKKWDTDFKNDESTVKRRFSYFSTYLRGGQWHLGHHSIPISGATIAALQMNTAAHEVVRDIRSYNPTLQDPNIALVENTLLPIADEVITDEEKDDADTPPAPEGPYDAWLKKRLEEICQHMEGWAVLCLDQKGKKKTRPYHINGIVNDFIDMLSVKTKGNLSNPKIWPRWNRFISEYAWEYAYLERYLAEDSTDTGTRSGAQKRGFGEVPSGKPGDTATPSAPKKARSSYRGI